MQGEPVVYRLSSKVDRFHAGWTLADYLTHRFRYNPLELWMKRLSSGKVSLNGLPGRPADTVQTGDTVEYLVEIVEPAVDFSYDVIFSDPDLLVVSKSGNIPVHAGGDYIGHTLIARLRSDFGEKLDLAHRLDRETSGLVVLSRSREASRALGAAFSAGAVEKRYLAVIHGRPSRDEFLVDAPLRKIGPRHPVPRVVVDPRAGRPSETFVRVVERLNGFSVVEARPRTGRTNQVRAHLECAGHPVVGDKKYGVPASVLRRMVADPSDPFVREHLILERQALHHEHVRFGHPITGEMLDLHAPVPSDIAAFVNVARDS